ncbi:hypothetical protein BT96DRAFT_1012663 [Gymnopus androsaceus JB14]|uniref:Uncharacterized protein n=1 Tax=Gymnopus androsaceus JB14 TaxID=1447944 RepID=A0A6A4IGL0_9AGAR|nr:hypothetical protein BT96DRAFT_1012663 [Gymnopus androsaceus JB14]
MSWTSLEIGPKRPQLLRITQAIYTHRNLPVPAALDHWWHSPQIKYLVDNHNALEPKICIINLGEGEPDHPAMTTHFMINLNNMSVVDKHAGGRFTAPQEIQNLLQEIKDYAVGDYRRQKEARIRCQRDEQRRREELARKERDDIVRLFQNNIITAEEIDTVVQGRPNFSLCPVCQETSPLAKCVGCKTYLCLTPGCEASESDDPKRCAQHFSQIYCKSCIASNGDINHPFLRPCPTDGCDRWTCKSDWQWCKGEPVDSVEVVNATIVDSAASPLTNAESLEAGGSKCPSTNDEQICTKKRKRDPQPRHSPRLSPCSQCLSSPTLNLDWSTCDSWNCWSSKAGPSIICPDCSPEGGLTCLNNHSWICDLCICRLVPLGLAVSLVANEMYCSKCDLIKRCEECGKSQMCWDCRTPDPEESANSDNSSLEDLELVSGCDDDSCDYLLCRFVLRRRIRTDVVDVLNFCAMIIGMILV